jgi:hypothetical protein
VTGFTDVAANPCHLVFIICTTRHPHLFRQGSEIESEAMTPKNTDCIPSSQPRAPMSRLRAFISWFIETDKEFRIRQKMVDDCHKGF